MKTFLDFLVRNKKKVLVVCGALILLGLVWFVAQKLDDHWNAKKLEAYERENRGITELVARYRILEAENMAKLENLEAERQKIAAARQEAERKASHYQVNWRLADGLRKDEKKTWENKFNLMAGELDTANSLFIQKDEQINNLKLEVGNLEGQVKIYADSIIQKDKMFYDLKQKCDGIIKDYALLQVKYNRLKRKRFSIGPGGSYGIGPDGKLHATASMSLHWSWKRI